MKVLEIKDVHKIYESNEIQVHAVNGVSLAFQEAEFVAIVGPSGSGKTTLLNLIGGLDKPTSGNIIIAGTDLSKLKSSQLIDFRMRNIGFVFQAYNLIPVLTAKENVEFIMSLQKWEKKERDERTFELLKAVGLFERSDSRPSKLSGGQQQRVAVARALASRPRFVLADEPTANLDSKSATTLLEIMEKLNHEEKITFIFSTHDPRVVKMAHRVITLEDGRVISDDVLEPLPVSSEGS
jgi:putative ABC transport system ATP-binding protein